MHEASLQIRYSAWLTLYSCLPVPREEKIMWDRSCFQLAAFPGNAHKLLGLGILVGHVLFLHFAKTIDAV